MTAEEYERIKEAEKEHLRAIRQIKRQACLATRTRSASRAVADMARSLESLLEEHREMTDRLTHDAALQEARLEVGLESVRDPEALEAPGEPRPDTGLPRPATSEPRPAAGVARDVAVPPLPEKTIGRMRGAS